ncbi:MULTISPECIES: hypothetical protein [Amycolatopsis]|uniref:Uncharacterized protein n=1 Tax=Amycolatopsis albidoflavus TaxID=102226 RepID=A0ABW5I8N3_9PSEU
MSAAGNRALPGERPGSFGTRAGASSALDKDSGGEHSSAAMLGRRAGDPESHITPP